MLLNGPLHDYPGSHRLPYYLDANYQNDGSNWLIGDKDYADYERFAAGRVAGAELAKAGVPGPQGRRA